MHLNGCSKSFSQNSVKLYSTFFTQLEINWWRNTLFIDQRAITFSHLKKKNTGIGL